MLFGASQNLKSFVPFPIHIKFNMVLVPEPEKPLVKFNEINEDQQKATCLYFGEIKPEELCVRFMLKKPDGKPREIQYCKYVPVDTIRHKKIITTTLYELTLISDDQGKDPHKTLEDLDACYTKAAQDLSLHETSQLVADSEKKEKASTGSHKILTIKTSDTEGHEEITSPPQGTPYDSMGRLAKKWAESH
jgi:hypothetical protein